MKLSKIKLKDLFLKANRNDIQNIVFMDQKTKPQKCDIGIIFGGTSMIPNRALEGIRLYKSGVINKILVSGGIGFFNKDRKKSEAYQLYQFLEEHGIPKEDILIESKSRSTFENMKNSLELVKKHTSLDQISFVLITSDFHIRRCLGLFRMHLRSSSRIYTSSIMDGKTDKNSWMKSFYGKRVILKEAILLIYCAKKHKIEDLEIKNLSFERKKKHC